MRRRRVSKTLLAKREYLLLCRGGCRHVPAWHPAVTARIVNYDYRLADLRRRLKCAKCGALAQQVGLTVHQAQPLRSSRILVVKRLEARQRSHARRSRRCAGHGDSFP
jgi:hypothetical protein